MNVEKRIQDNTEMYQEDVFSRGRLIPSNKEQRDLTQKWILPYKEDIVREAKILRVAADRELLKRPAIKISSRYYKRRYPIGCCHHIRTAVFDRMKKALYDRSMPGMQAVRSFVREGGVLQGFWGIDNNAYFQNAIQIGTSILDVANDTVSPAKDPVVFYEDMDSSPLKRIESFEEFAAIVSKYWGADVYPNIYFPELAPIFPLITISPEKDTTAGKLSPYLSFEKDVSDLLLSNIYTTRRNELFGLAAHFLFEGPYAHKRLPEKVLKKLMDSGLKRFNQPRYNVFRLTTDPEEAKEIFARFHVNKSNPEEANRAVSEALAEAREKYPQGLRLSEFVLERIDLS